MKKNALFLNDIYEFYDKLSLKERQRLVGYTICTKTSNSLFFPVGNENIFLICATPHSMDTNTFKVYSIMYDGGRPGGLYYHDWRGQIIDFILNTKATYDDREFLDTIKKYFPYAQQS